MTLSESTRIQYASTDPGASLTNRLTRSRVLRPSRLEPVEDVLRARCHPQGEELVVRTGEGRADERVSTIPGAAAPSRRHRIPTGWHTPPDPDDFMIDQFHLGAISMAVTPRTLL